MKELGPIVGRGPGTGGAPRSANTQNKKYNEHCKAKLSPLTVDAFIYKLIYLIYSYDTMLGLLFVSNVKITTESNLKIYHQSVADPEICPGGDDLRNMRRVSTGAGGLGPPNPLDPLLLVQEFPLGNTNVSRLKGVNK